MTKCIICTPGETPSAEPCCDDRCLEVIARRECALYCRKDDTSRCCSDQATFRPKLESPLPTVQSNMRKRKACSSHYDSVYERYAIILATLGCLCKQLIEHNLEPCCNEGKLPLPSPAKAAQTTTKSTLGMNDTVCSCGPVEKECLQRGGPKGSLKVQECCVSEKMTKGANFNKSSCCGLQGQINCSGTEGKIGCSNGNESKYCSVGGNRCCNNKTKLVTTIKPYAFLAKKDDCKKSEDKSGYCSSQNQNCSGLKADQDTYSVAKTDGDSGVKSDNCCSSKESCCGTVEEDDCCGNNNARIMEYTGDSCCTRTDNSTTVNKAPDRPCCSPGHVNPDEALNVACCNGSCSSPEKEDSTPNNPRDPGPSALDVEKSDSAGEHVVLNVQGLTCGGCETKLFKSLQEIPGVRNLHTSLVLSQAQFVLDQKARPVTEVIKSIERATGFTCQQLNIKGQVIDVIVDDDTRAFVEGKYPEGVIEMTVTGKQTVRIVYDATCIGARALLKECFHSGIELAPPHGSSEFENGWKHVRYTAWITLVSAILTIPVLVLAWAPLPPRPLVYGGVSLALASIVQFAIAGPFYPSALRALIFTHVIEMDLLIVLSTSTAYVFSVVSFAYLVAGRPLSIGEFFETSTLLVTLIMLGRLISAFARQTAVESVSIRSLQAEKAILCGTDGRVDQEIDARLLQYGDLFQVSPDSRITTDGIVVSGMTEVDESMVTGESLPVEKLPGSSVIAGSLNSSGVIVVRVTQLPGHNTISTIAAMVDKAKFSKPKTQELVDIVAGYFVPVILILTIITFGIWIAIGISVRHQTGGQAVVNAITFAISALIVSCPCAIGLAVPMVVVIAGSVAAKHGVIFRSAVVIEIARKVSHVVFDKTGTLTKGELSVAEEVYLSEKHDLALSIALGLTSNNKHPVSVAISSYLKKKAVEPAQIENVQSVTGKGIEGTMNDSRVRCGNTRWLSPGTLPEIQYLLTKAYTVFCVALDDQPIAAFGLSDALRPDSHFVVVELQKRNIAISIVSGDDAGPVDAIAAALGIPSSHARSRCTPGDKQKYLEHLMTDWGQIVVFCGDGTNDAVALAQADIGVHMNCGGSDVAQAAADAVIVRPYLGGILVLLDLSMAAFHRILFNFAWSAVYNLFAILLAAGAFVNARIPPQYAGLGEIVSVLPVVLIAWQLRWFKRRY